MYITYFNEMAIKILFNNPFIMKSICFLFLETFHTWYNNCKSL